ncbi:MAG: PP2C family protein-serine/threonine phosphatase [Oscillibacter sp.]|nr:PP2C family protein-serine/threonine phosphatase [Oscillibacter sp.]
MKTYRNPLRRSILFGCGMFVILLCLTLSVLGFAIYYNGMMEKYQTYIGDALTLTMTEIDGEDLKRCIESGEKSEQFQHTQDFLNRVMDRYDFYFLYIVKPLNLNKTDNMMDVMAGMTEAEREALNGVSSVTLGGLTGESYPPKVAQFYLNAMDGGQKISYYLNYTEFGFMYTGLVPVLDASGNAVAILAADLSIREVVDVFLRYVLIVLAEIVILSTLFLFILYRWLNRRVIAPMTKLERSAQSFVLSSQGEENPDALTFKDPEIHTGDELESLSSALSSMSYDMKRFMKNLLKVTAEKERIGAELNVATKIQADMLPRIFPAFPDRKEFDLYATMTPAKEVGGDFYDFFMIDDDRLAMVMADVSGKGVPAALFMVIAKTLLKNRAQQDAGREIHPGQILADVNNQLCENNDEELFVTVWLGVLAISTGHLISASAGHEYPAFYRAGAKFELQKERHGPPLATLSGLRYRENETDLGHGDALFIYTDGVTEATSAQEELFGEERMINALNVHAEDAPETIISDVRKDIDAFVKEAPQFDDITMLCLRYR